MRLLKITMLVLLLIFSFGCERDPKDNKSFGQEEVSSEMESQTQNSESEFDIQEEVNQEVDNQEIDSTQAAISGIEPSHNTIAKTVVDKDPAQKKPPVDNNQNTSIFNVGSWSLAEKVLLGSILLNLLLIGQFIRLFRRNTSLNIVVDEQNTKLNNKNSEIWKLKTDIQQKNNRNANQFQQKKPEKVINEVKRFQGNQGKSDSLEEKSHEVILDHKITTPSSPTVETKPQIILYAGKPSDANTFSAVSSQQDQHRSIFKLILENKEADNAKFEVIENEYILKMAANSPDTYLYHVCKPENSNQNFDGRILTTEKGTARLLDGKWKVNDEDKATIKFQ